MTDIREMASEQIKVIYNYMFDSMSNEDIEIFEKIIYILESE